ncbi:hypothetical protein ACFY8W_02940 [Streptomyces sp. NPDC012637]|uniref:hypothetical protein n=1 Tax=Streptomyces sp. NPDC012637 TaxID=3364842 RepID=UPI0036EB2C44
MRSREYDLEFRATARRTSAWGVGLLAVATLLWTWCALLLLTPYEVEDKPNGRSTRECESRLLTEYGTANEGLQRGDWCQDERDWPEALLILGLSVPVSVAGTALYAIGTVSSRMSAHSEAMRELDGLADARGA